MIHMLNSSTKMLRLKYDTTVTTLNDLLVHPHDQALFRESLEEICINKSLSLRKSELVENGEIVHVPLACAVFVGDVISGTAFEKFCFDTGV